MFVEIIHLWVIPQMITVSKVRLVRNRLFQSALWVQGSRESDHALLLSQVISRAVGTWTGTHVGCWLHMLKISLFYHHTVPNILVLNHYFNLRFFFVLKFKIFTPTQCHIEIFTKLQGSWAPYNLHYWYVTYLRLTFQSKTWASMFLFPLFQHITASIT